MNNVSNPNDFKVVHFTNKTDFDFTPEMGCMYDSRPISGVSGKAGVIAGESMTLPYHVGHRLATNLAKVVRTRSAPTTDPAGIPTGVVLWTDADIETLKNSYLTELYSESRPTAQTETDRLLEQVEQLKKFVVEKLGVTDPVPQVESTVESEVKVPVSAAYQDKAEVIAELEKRGIAHDKRQNKANLEKLLA